MTSTVTSANLLAACGGTIVDVNKTYDVFISHSATDSELATEIAKACRAHGLEAVTSAELPFRVNVSDVLWEALAESRALLTILSRPGPTPSMAIDIGAARAWNKPIFAVVTDPSFTRLPAELSGVHLYTSGRIEDVIKAIKQSGRQLTEEDRSFLAKVYAEVGVSVDQLALDPRHLQELVNQFNIGTGKTLPGERLLSELLRMRKQGRLMRSHSGGRSRSREGTA